MVLRLVLFILFPFLGYQVFTKKQYWNWVKTVFLPGVFAGRWYNGRYENQTMYIGNKRSVLVGMARGRQLRVQPGEFRNSPKTQETKENFTACHSFSK